MTIQELEIKHGVLAENRELYPANKEITEEEFLEAVHGNPDDWRGCNIEDRTQFLIDNGYEVTHENMLNWELSAVVPEVEPQVEHQPYQLPEEDETEAEE